MLIDKGQQSRKWRGAGPLLDLAAEISAGRRLGKGRQTFVLLLGERGGGGYANILGELLADTEVRGHALDSLRKAKIGGFVEEARIIAAEAGGWIRQSARRYIKDFPEV